MSETSPSEHSPERDPPSSEAPRGFFARVLHRIKREFTPLQTSSQMSAGIESAQQRYLQTQRERREKLTPMQRLKEDILKKTNTVYGFTQEENGLRLRPHTVQFSRDISLPESFQSRYADDESKIVTVCYVDPKTDKVAKDDDDIPIVSVGRLVVARDFMFKTGETVLDIRPIDDLTPQELEALETGFPTTD